MYWDNNLVTARDMLWTGGSAAVYFWVRTCQLYFTPILIYLCEKNIFDRFLYWDNKMVTARDTLWSKTYGGESLTVFVGSHLWFCQLNLTDSFIKICLTFINGFSIIFLNFGKEKNKHYFTTRRKSIHNICENCWLSVRGERIIRYSNMFK